MITLLKKLQSFDSTFKSANGRVMSNLKLEELKILIRSIKSIRPYFKKLKLNDIDEIIKLDLDFCESLLNDY